MNTKWLYTTDSSSKAVDDRGGALKYWFRYTVGTMATAVDLATCKYEWEDRPDEVSSITLESYMKIEHAEEYLASEYDDWAKACQFWAERN